MCATYVQIVNMRNNQQICITAGSIAGISFAAYLVYRYIRKNGSSARKTAEVKTSRPARIEVMVPKKFMGSVIGRGGSTIKTIEKKTNSRVILKKELQTEEFRVFEIRGAPENAQLAETLLLKIIRNESEINSQEIFIPHAACGKVIGKKGKNIRAITNTSGARIKVDDFVNEQGEHKITITGTQEQIESAMLNIYGVIHNEAVNISSPEQIAERKHYKQVFTVLGLREGQMEVCVSAMESPSRFWIQVLGPQCLDLDVLVQKMTQYYAEPISCLHHSLKDIFVGQLVAAQYGEDEKWYRAKVIDVSEKEVTLFYLDYGDTDTVARNNVFALDLQFLTLNFLAFECRLAHVIPYSGEWCDGAKDFFRKYCQVAQWKTLEARVMNLLQLKVEQNEEIVLEVELYDKGNGKTKISCASEEMRRKGFAKSQTDE